MAIEVLKHGPSSRSEIARRLGMSAGSITRLANPLLESGLLVEGAAPATSAAKGRPVQPLDIVTDPWHVAGIKITADAVHGVVTTLKSTVVEREVRTLPSSDPEAVADVAQDVIASFTARHPQIAGVGVGLAGTVRERAVAVESPFLHWSDVAFGPLLAERTGLPVVLENDVAALVEAETWFGAGRGVNRFAVLTIGAGIGYGLVVDGDPVRTPDDSLDLGGYWIIDPGGPLTPQGRRGSATSLLTVPSIEYQVRAATGTAVGYEEILDQARRGSPAASRVIGEAARGLGVLIAQIANFALPDKLLLAGEGVGLMDVAGDLVRATAAEHRHPDARPVELEVKAADFHDWARGAAVLAIQVLVLGAENAVSAGSAGNPVGSGSAMGAANRAQGGNPKGTGSTATAASRGTTRGTATIAPTASTGRAGGPGGAVGRPGAPDTAHATGPHRHPRSEEPRP